MVPALQGGPERPPVAAAPELHPSSRELMPERFSDPSANLTKRDGVDGGLRLINLHDCEGQPCQDVGLGST